MHHDGVAGHQRWSAHDVPQASTSTSARSAFAQGLRRQLGIGVGEGTVCRVDGVMTAADAVVAQHDAPGARRLAADHAEYLFDIVVGYRVLGRKEEVPVM